MRGKMSGVPLVLGPFPGGINNRTDAASLDDTQLADCINFIYGIDGTLVARWPYVEFEQSGLEGTAAPLNLLGWTVMYTIDANQQKAVTSHAVLFGSNNADGTFVYNNGVWTKISDDEYKCFVAYGNTDNQVFFPGNPNNTVEKGGVWKYGEVNVVPLDDMPQGNMMVTHKERLWISGDPDAPSRLYYSIVTPQGELGDWDLDKGAGFIDVEPGNGQSNSAMYAFSDSIVIFKDDSTYALSYDGNISRGQLIQVNPIIGAQNPDCVVPYKNILAVYHEGKVYAYGNGSFTELNNTFRFYSNPGFVSTYTQPLSLSCLGDDLVLRHYDKIFYYSFISGGWGKWETDLPVGKMWVRPTFIGEEVQQYTTSCIEAGDPRVFTMQRTWTLDDIEIFTCKVKTKTYNFETPYSYKRLFWWGIEAITNMNLTGAAQPVSVNFVPTWGEVRDIPPGTWGSLTDNYWGRLYSQVPDVVTGPINAFQGSNVRRMYKFLKGLRFRSISFQITMDSDGTAVNGPQRLLSIIPFINAKETVVQQVS